jgi:hypothetical protein
MKYAYIDESGVSIHERVLVVAGVLVDADSQWKSAAEHLDLLVEEFVPVEHRNGFIFHATELFHRSGPIAKDRAHEALEAILKLPAQLGLAVAFGYVRKLPLPELPSGLPQKIRRKQVSIDIGINHSVAFCLCTIGVERYMKEDTHPDEIATLIVENNTDTQRDIKSAYNAMKGKNLKSERERFIWDFLRRRHPESLPIRRVIDVPHMVQKHEASLLQIADACAMVIRHCLEERTNAQPFINALSIGQPTKIHDNGRFIAHDRPAGYNILTFSRP